METGENLTAYSSSNGNCKEINDFLNKKREENKNMDFIKFDTNFNDN